MYAIVKKYIIILGKTRIPLHDEYRLSGVYMRA